MTDLKKHFPLISCSKTAEEKLCNLISIVTDFKNISTNNKLLLKSIFSNSPYLSSLIFKNPEYTLSLMTQEVDILLKDLFDKMSQTIPKIMTLNELKKKLRIYKTKIALLTSYADLSEKYNLFQITKALSDFAELAVSLSTAYLLKEAMIKGDLEIAEHFKDQEIENIPATTDFAKNCGYIVLAVGKLGGRELNYSSDIDLIILYDHEIIQYRGRKNAKDFFIKFTQKFVNIMQDRTEDGYVFRTDLRLRPDPSATPVALSMEAAEIYYQTSGLTWERAAMIKARPIAGDIRAGYDFLKRINSFIWRKHLDYAALEDIHSIKKLIHSHHKHGQITLAGQDVKLGPGGIREIEFYAQVFQLISGGKEPTLRVPATCDALNMLLENKKITKDSHKTLISVYVFLRTLEHRLQMVNDDQTHSIPKDALEIDRIAKFMGYKETSDFEKEFVNNITNVHHLFNDLLYDNTQSTSKNEAILPFLPNEYHPATLKAIEKSGYDDAKQIYSIIQNWLNGRYRACRTERARDKLLHLIPDILRSFSHYKNAKEGFLKFDHFLSQLPSGIQLFSFLSAQPWLLDLLAKIMNMAPDLSASLAKRPLLLDAMLTDNFFTQSIHHQDQSLKNMLQKDLEIQMSLSKDFEDTLNICRKWANEHKFQVGIQILKNDVSSCIAGKNLSLIAEITLQNLLAQTHEVFSLKHGIIKDSQFSIIALGKLGGKELTSISDLDLIFVYDYKGDNSSSQIKSNGKKPLELHQYYVKLSKKFLNSINVLTGEGRLYEVDMRLRPSGSKGALALDFKAFQTYHMTQAWTWEHMTLTRARVISGSSELNLKLTKLIQNIITHQGRSPQKLLNDTAIMREKLRHEFGTDNIWSLKHVKGGMVDIEFICQYLVLKNSPHNNDLLEQNTLKLIRKLTKYNFLTPETGVKLYDACKDFQTCQLLLRLCMGTASKNSKRPEELLQSLAKRIGCDSPEQIENKIINSLQFVTQTYEEIISSPANHLPKEIASTIFEPDIAL